MKERVSGMLNLLRRWIMFSLRHILTHNSFYSVIELYQNAYGQRKTVIHGGARTVIHRGARTRTSTHKNWFIDLCEVNDNWRVWSAPSNNIRTRSSSLDVGSLQLSKMSFSTLSQPFCRTLQLAVRRLASNANWRCENYTFSLHTTRDVLLHFPRRSCDRVCRGIIERDDKKSTDQLENFRNCC